MRRLPPLNALRAFEAAARLSSVTGAAAELGVSHSAISQQIRLLEEHFGETLFARRGRRIEPTPAAITLLEDVSAAFDHVALACERLARRGRRRVLTVNAPACFALKWLIPRIPAFEQQYPGLEVRVTTSEASAISRLDRPYDLIVRRDAMSRHAHLCMLLLDDHATAVAHPRLLERRPLTHPALLGEFVLLHDRSRPAAWRRWFHEHGAGEGFITPDGPSFDNTALSIQGAISGLGAAIAPLALVADDIAEGRLAAPFPKQVLAEAGFHILLRESAAEERGPRELLRWLGTQAGAHLPAERTPTQSRRRA
jgi:LysR family glycine cleavage system transcriptional activator